MPFESERRGSTSEGWERMKKGPEYEVKCRAGGAARESAPTEVSIRNSMEATEHDSVMEDLDVLPQVVQQFRLRSDETNVVVKGKEDGGENGCSKVVNVGADVLEQVWIGSERENAEGRGVVSYRSSLSQGALGEQRNSVFPRFGVLISGLNNKSTLERESGPSKLFKLPEILEKMLFIMNQQSES